MPINAYLAACKSAPDQAEAPGPARPLTRPRPRVAPPAPHVPPRDTRAGIGAAAPKPAIRLRHTSAGNSQHVLDRTDVYSPEN